MSQNPADLAVQTVMGLVHNYWVTRSVWVAADLGIADQLVSGAKSVEEIAKGVGTLPSTTRRLMRALVSEGFFSESGGKYVNSPKSEALRSDVPWSMRAVARAELGQEHYGAWEELLHCMKTGKTGMGKKYGQEIWEYYPAHPQHGSVFNECMSNITTGVEMAVLAAYDFTPFKHIVDVAGGHGRLLKKVLGKNSTAIGTLFDMPSVIEASHELDGLANRTTKVAGDFFKAVPAGGDLYMLKFIIHDWADAESVTILRNVREGMAAGGKVILVEMVLPDSNEPSIGKFMDLNMLVMTSGMERTKSEYEKLLAAAGLKLSRVVTTGSIFSVVEAVKG
jgi:hypothetical protein